jgi:hypothetical protein
MVKKQFVYYMNMVSIKNLVENNAVWNNIRTYFDKLQYGAKDVPSFDVYLSDSANKCSPKQGERGGVTTTDPTYKQLAQLIKNNVTKSYVHKHKLCFIAYILYTLTGKYVDNGQPEYKKFLLEHAELFKFIINDGTEQDFYNYIMNTDPDEFVLSDESLVVLASTATGELTSQTIKNVIAAWREFTYGLLKSELMFESAKNNTDLIAAYKKLTEQLFTQVPPSIVGDLSNFKLTTTFTYDKLNERKAAIEKFLNIIDTAKCTKRERDLLTMEEFSNLTFADIGAYMHLIGNDGEHSGQCFSMSYILGALFTSFDNIAFDDLVIKNEETFKTFFKGTVIPSMAEYYDRLIIKNSEHDDVNMLKYHLEEFIKKLESVKSTQSAQSVSSIISYCGTIINQINEKTKTNINLIINNVFLYAFNKYRITVNSTIILDIYKAASDVLFTLIGLLGYELSADSPTSSEIEGFDIAEHCMGEFLNVMDQLKNITFGTPQTSPITFFDAMSAINVTLGNNNTNLKEILQDAEHQCIHGTGFRLMGAYISIYETLVQVIPDVKLAPFILQAPMDLLSNLNGIKYFTCIKEETKNAVDNPYNTAYLIQGYAPTGLTVRIQVLTKMRYSKQSANIDILDFLEERREHIIVGEPTNEANALIEYLQRSDNQTFLQQLLRIPYLFQNDRKILFEIYSKFCVHACRLVGNVNETNTKKKRYNTFKKNTSKHSSTSVYDVIEAEEIKLSTLNVDKLVKSFCSYTADGKHYLNNTANANVTTPWQVDLNQNIWDMEFVKEALPNGEEAPVVKNFTQQNITRVYFYIRLLSRILSPEKVWSQLRPSQSTTDGIEDYFLAFEKLYRGIGQELSFTTNIWFTFYSITVDGTTPATLDDLNQAIFKVIRSNPSLYKILNGLRNHHLAKLEGLYTDIYNWCLTVSVEEISIDLDGSKKLVISKAALLQEIQLKITNIALVLSAVFAPEKFNEVRKSTGSLGINKLSIKPKLFFNSFKGLLYDIIKSIYPYGDNVGTYQFNFTEILRDLRFYELLAKKVVLDKPLPVELNIVKGYLKTHVPYYEGFKEVINVREDYPILLEHLIKAKAFNYIQNNMALKLRQFNDQYINLIKTFTDNKTKEKLQEFHDGFVHRNKYPEYIINVFQLNWFSGGKQKYKSKAKSIKATSKTPKSKN